MKKRISVQIALLFLAAGLLADITLPTQAPPQADAQTARVWRGGQTTIPLRAHYGGGGTVIFLIVQRPAHGKLSDLRLLGDNRAAITYENDGAESVTSDGLRYVARTSDGRTSSPAEVQINVEEAAARMAVPAAMEFDEVMAGESEHQPLSITNEGGGVLEGRMSVSAPWELAATEYRVRSGQTEVVEVIFRPNEGRKFVGQITLTGTDGGQTSVQLTGTAIAPVRTEPDHLQIDLPKTEGDPRAGLVSLTNTTESVLRLKMEGSSNIQSIPEVVLAPHETKRISIVVLLHRAIALHEEIVFAGSGFISRVQIDAEAEPPTPMVSRRPLSSPAPTPAAFPSATPTGRMIQTGPTPMRGVVAPASPPGPPRGVFVAVQAQRLDAARWELRWAPAKAAANYRIDERFLSLNDTGELQTIWRTLSPLEIAQSGGEIFAQIQALDPKQLHMLRVIALGADGAILWESPPVALATRGEPPQGERGWLLVFALALVVFLFLRWRARRALA